MEEPKRFIPGVSFDANATVTKELQRKVERMYEMQRTRDLVKRMRDRLAHINNMG